MLAGDALSEVRRGKNTRHLLTGLLRQSVYGRLAGYEDVNDAERLAFDPVMRAIVDRRGLDGTAASRSQIGRYYVSFDYQAQSWDRARRVVAKIEWHPGELIPRHGFIVTNLSRPAERVVAFYNRRGTAEQWIKEGKHAIKWTRLSCQKCRANEVRLQLHALAYNLANLMRTLALPRSMAHWSLTTLREKLVKIGARMVRHGRYITFQLAEVAVSGRMFGQILGRIARLRAPPVPA